MFSFENEIEETISGEVQMYAQKKYESQLVEGMLSTNASSHTSIAVDSMSLFESNIAFAHYMFQNPRRALKLLDDAFQKVSFNISQTHNLKSDMVYKENLHVRLIALPNLPEVNRSNLPNCSDVGQFLCISGTVIRASTSKMLQYKKLWRCSKCKYEFIVEAEVEQGYICEKPAVCGNPEWCNGKNFTLMNSDINTDWCKDYQEIKLQEQVYNLNIGTVPRSMWVVLEDDLVELCYPGNDVIVSGVLIQQWKPLSRGSLIDIDLVILGHNIEVQNKMSSGVVSKDMAREFGLFWQSYKADPLSGRNFILSSICPQVFGLYIVKLAVALILAGGVQKKSGSSRIRGDSHLLLIGDPGTAKSQFLKFATKVSSRSVLTSGIGTTNAGLTVSAVKEGGRWELEAGALVLADGGICCIDEFSCIKEQDKTCIHEAMEQQTISVAKAGLVCSLNTRCSILAATNPKGKYDESMSLSENTALGSPLLSRFDIILVLLDTYDENWDDMVSSYILNGRNILYKNEALWPIAKIKSYFILIRHINPKLTAEAERVLRAYYTKQRSLQSRNASRTTPRLLQSLIRLAEGHARLMFRSEILIIDAIMAIILIESSMLGNSILEGLSPLHTVFPNNPSNEYKERVEKVFQNLNIEVPSEEHQHFYEEAYLKNLFSDIFSLWSSKENPYLFESTTDNNCNTGLPQESSEVFNTSEMIMNETNSDNSEIFFHKRARYSIDSAENCISPEPVVVEACRNDYVSSAERVHSRIEDEVTTLSNLKDIYDMSETETSQNIFNKNSSNADNLSILHQVLEEPDFLECQNIVSAHPIPNEMSQNIFNSDINQVVVSKECIINRHSQCSENLSDKSISVSNIFPLKRSLSDQLKNFTFSKTRFNSQGNFLNNKTTTSILHPKNKPKLNTEKQEQSKTNVEMSQPIVKRSVFKMIVDKSKNSQSQTATISIKENALNVQEVLNKQQFNSCNNIKENQKTNVITRDTEVELEINGTSSCITDPNSINFITIAQSQPVPGKKLIPDKLKKFVFSKHKASKSSNC